MAVQVQYRDLGLVPYDECWALQRELFDKMISLKASGEKPTAEREGVDGGWLLMCEHPHVYTLGKSGKRENMLVSDAFLRSIGAEFRAIDRGGDITYHGPGQLVGYPILDLQRVGIGLRDYIAAIEQSVIDTIAEWGLRGERSSGATGVWLSGGARGLRKICAIGVHSAHWVTMHGWALNVETDLKYFGYINPCGFTDRGVTSLTAEVGTPITVADVKPRLCRHLEKNMNIEIIK